MLEGLRFNQPVLAQLAPAAFLAVLIVSWLIARWQRNFLLRFGSLETLARFSKFSSRGRSAVLLGLAFALAFLAASEPSMSSGRTIASRTFNGIIVLDVSRSMLAEDTPNGSSRSSLAVEAALELIDAYPDGLVGLVIFTDRTQAYPPTRDHDALRILLTDQADPYRAKGAGSDIAAGLEAAVEIVDDLEVPIQAIVLLSDGGELDERLRLVRSVEDLNQIGLRVIAGGLGAFQPVRIPVRDEDGALRGYYSKSTSGGPFVYTYLNESSLRFIADQTGGAYRFIEEGNELVDVVRLRGWDSQPAIQEGETSLVRYPLLGVLLIILIFILDKRRAG